MQGRFLVAGTNSGCGKTTVCMALLAALKKRGAGLNAFKCGPDYIDPMFHRAVLGVPSYNLDPYFCDPQQLRTVYASHAGELSVIEGVMGYYDGIGTEGRASTFDVAKATETPVVLVINVRGMYTSAGAVIRGFRDFRPDSRIEGVIFNGASAMLYKDLKAIAENAGVKAYGFLPKMPEAELGSRHLGLITAEEIEDLRERIDKLAEKAEECVDIDGLIELANTAPLIEGGKLFTGEPVYATVCRGNFCGLKRPVLAVAKDKAFCFIYEENLELFKAAGFNIEYFSPMSDSEVPRDADALYLPGGYPELYTKELSDNVSMRASVKKAVQGGLPTFAECGGFLYLHSELDGVPMAGVFAAKAYNTSKLQRFGYVELTAAKDNLFCRKGESIRAHEFHYYDSEDPGRDFRAEKASGARGWDCVVATDTLYAGFPHLYLAANPEFARTFAGKAAQYASEKTADSSLNNGKAAEHASV